MLVGNFDLGVKREGDIIEGCHYKSFHQYIFLPCLVCILLCIVVDFT